MSEKKRKRADNAADHRTQKKAFLQAPAETIHISVLEQEKRWVPVVGRSVRRWCKPLTNRLSASTPGFSVPLNASFTPYSMAETKYSTLLLHSNFHPKLDYSAHEETSNGLDRHLNHYVGVYDPQRGKLQLIPARKMVVRGTLKSARSGISTDSEDEEKLINRMSARNALGLAFGTKKSKKAIRSLTANAISPSKPFSSIAPSKAQMDPLAEAVISSMPSISTTATREILQAEIDVAKPRPKPNLQATTPAEVYTISQLVDGDLTLCKLHVKDWIDAVNAGGNVPTRSLYVSQRLVKTVQSGNVKLVRALKYLYLLIEWSKTFRQSGPKTGKRVPTKLENKELASLIEGWGTALVLGLSKRFADNGILNKWHQDNLITHILALTLIIDGFTVDTLQIQKDLKLEAKQIAEYYHELGCVVTVPRTKLHLERMGISKAEAHGRRVAMLKVPLVIPKQRGMVVRKKR